MFPPQRHFPLTFLSFNLKTFVLSIFLCNFAPVDVALLCHAMLYA